MKHIFIVNPAAGKRDATEYVTEKVKLSGIENYEIYRTKAPGDATDYIKNLLNNTNEEIRFYSCGGDGTLNEVANGAVSVRERGENGDLGSMSAADFVARAVEETESRIIK